MEFEGGGHAHGDVVLFAAGGGDRVGAGGVGEDLRFIEESGGGDVGDHEARGDAGSFGEEGRETFVDVGVDEAVDAALGDGHEGGESDGGGIEGERERRAVEIAAGEDVALREDEGIVGGGAGFNFKGGEGMGERVADGAVDLGHAAEAIGVLQPRVVVAVGLANLAVGEQVAEMLGGGDLAGVGTSGMDAGIEWRGRAAESFEGHGAGEVGEFGDAESANESESADGGDGLGAVEERESFFSFEGEGRAPGFEQGHGGGDGAAVLQDHAFADEGEGEVGQRGQIAAGADGATGGDDGVDPVIEEEEQGVDDRGPDAAEAFGEDVGAKQEHGADGGVRERIAEAAGMAADEVALQVLKLGGIDADVRKLAEAGIDAVGGFAAGEEGIDDSAGSLDAGERGGIEGDGAGFKRHLGDGVEGEGLTGEEERGGHRSLGYRLQVTGDRVQVDGSWLGGGAPGCGGAANFSGRQADRASI